MSQPSLLISQCLQNDFVKPLGKFASMPNQLHIGGEEARRLIGEDPEQGPIARLMQWAYAHPQDELAIVHIRDVHDPDDRTQIDHLRQFGPHCLQGTEGAEFAFPTPADGREAIVVESPGLNDFIGTTLAETLASVGVGSGKAGVTGVWTEAKVFFLCYGLRTRYPDLEIGVCSALTASSSRAQHFIALDQLSRLLGVKVFSSVGAFTEWLGGEELSVGLPAPSYEEQLKIEVVGDANITDVDERLIRFLFRDCREVRLRVLDGGFSGNLVLGAASRDFHGHDQVLHVIKIGEQELMGQERTAFEHVEEVLGNNAPSITEFADLEGRGALKYRYAAMGAGGVRTLQQIYEEGEAPEKTEFYLQTVFGDQLGRFYRAAELEWCNLLEYYWFSPERAGGVRENVEAILGTPADGPTLQLPSGHSFPNPCVFYEQDLEDIYPHATRSTYFSYLHGDLNGANIMVDAQDNVWLIDFFHTHRGHVLKDLIKFENDLLYIYTKLDDERDLADAIQLFEELMKVEDLARPLPSADEAGITGAKFRRTWETLQLLRSFFPKLVTHDREPLQLLIAQMRYSAHTLVFHESSELQKQWALHSTGVLGAEIARRLRARGQLRVDWFNAEDTGKGRMGITLLPGRRDHRRDLELDIEALKEAGVTHVVPLLTNEELWDYGVSELMEKYGEVGLAVRRLPILDQGTSSVQQMNELLDWVDERLEEGAKVLVHCVGGLGRAGLVGASYLRRRGMTANAAIAEVRRVRSPRALESAVQEEFVQKL